MILSVKLHCLYVNLARASKKVLFYNNKQDLAYKYRGKLNQRRGEWTGIGGVFYKHDQLKVTNFMVTNFLVSMTA